MGVIQQTMRRTDRFRKIGAKNLAIISACIVIIAGSLSGIAYAVYALFFMPNGTMVPAFEEGRLNLVIEGNVITEPTQPKLVEGEILLPLDTIRRYFDRTINWDAKLHKLNVTTKDRVIRMKTDSLQAFVNNKPVTLDIPVMEEAGKVFAPIEFLSDFYNIDITYVKENNVIVIDYKNGIKQTGEPLTADAVVRNGKSRRSPILKKYENGVPGANSLRIFDEDEKWYKVRTDDGIIGYAEKKYVAANLPVEVKAPEEKPQDAVWKPKDGKLNMAWDYIGGSRIKLSSRKKIDGLDVISPTWFQVTGEDGAIKNNADAKYIDWAHNNGYKVWALFSNNFSDPAKSSNFLSNTDARDNAIRQLLAFTSLYRLDGINIDFENLLESDKDALTQFVREITPLLREQGLIVSIDVNTAPCYDREALGGIVDYVALMAYDQHWKGGKTAGSVAELDWVDSTVNSFLKAIPEEKLILGIPFYTRVWMLTADKDGEVKLDSEALSMQEAEKLIRNNAANVVWEETSGQFYAEYAKKGTTYRIWLEDINSLNLRTSLVQKYKLAGAAAWRLDYETPDVWKAITDNLKDLKTYDEWQQKNAGKSYIYTK